MYWSNLSSSRSPISLVQHVLWMVTLPDFKPNHADPQPKQEMQQTAFQKHPLSQPLLGTTSCCQLNPVPRQTWKEKARQKRWLKKTPWKGPKCMGPSPSSSLQQFRCLCKYVNCNTSTCFFEYIISKSFCYKILTPYQYYLWAWPRYLSGS